MVAYICHILGGMGNGTLKLPSFVFMVLIVMVRTRHFVRHLEIGVRILPYVMVFIIDFNTMMWFLMFQTKI